MSRMRALTVTLICFSSLSINAAAQSDKPTPKQESSKPAGPALSEMPQGITAEQAKAILSELQQIREILERQSGDSIANELRLIRVALERVQPAGPVGTFSRSPNQPPTRNAKLSITGQYVLGRNEAPLTMIEFADYQCPACRAFHSSVFAQIKKEWVDTGKLRFVSWDMPLPIHQDAMRAAQAARCAGEQNKFWEMRDQLIADAAPLELEAILGYAKKISQLETDHFSECLKTGKYEGEIKKETENAISQGVMATPSFLIGQTNGDIVNGTLLLGAQSYEAFEGRMKMLLGSPH